MFINDYRVIISRLELVKFSSAWWSPSKSDGEYKPPKIILENFSFLTNFTNSTAGYPHPISRIDCCNLINIMVLLPMKILKAGQ
jgi:hypothetical protein